MNEDSLNLQIRKFLKKVGVTSQREIETAMRRADAAGKLHAGDEIPLDMQLRIDALDVSLHIKESIRVE